MPTHPDLRWFEACLLCILGAVIPHCFVFYSFRRLEMNEYMITFFKSGCAALTQWSDNLPAVGPEVQFSQSSVQFSSVVHYLVPPFWEHPCVLIRHSCITTLDGLDFIGHCFLSSIIVFKVQFSSVQFSACPAQRHTCFTCCVAHGNPCH